MIAFATAMIDPEAYRRHARPGIERAVEPDSNVLAFAALGSICRSLNLLLEQAARLDGLEALVIVDQDTEIADPELCAKARAALADPDVAVVGCVGATGVRSAAWWEGAVVGGRPLEQRVVAAEDRPDRGELVDLRVGLRRPEDPGPRAAPVHVGLRDRAAEGDHREGGRV